MNMANPDDNAAAGPRPTDQEWLEDDFNLRHWLDVLWSGRWWIVGITAAALVVATLDLLTSRAVYQADALIRIEQKNSPLSGMEALEEITGGRPETSAQIEILKSRSVLGATVDRLNLTVEAEPNRLPVLYPLLKGSGSDKPAEPWFGLERYDWGGSRIRVGRMEVPDRLRGQRFTLVAQEGSAYRLKGPDGAHILDGKEGAVESAAFGGGQVTLFVEDLVARPGTELRVWNGSRLGTIGGLRGRLSVRQRGQDTGVVQLRLKGHDRTRIEHTLATLADVFLRQNTERRSAEARESLKFIESQLPELRQKVKKAEAKLSDYQQRQETVDLTVQTEKLLGQLVEIDQKISELQTRRAEASRTYGPEHPVIEAIEAQLDTLRQEKAQLDKRVGTLPEKQREMLSLKRELEVNTKVYTEMLNTAQELRVAKAGTVGNVRIIDDAAVSGGSIAPNTTETLVLHALLGGILGCAFVIGRRVLQRGVETPDELEQRTGLTVYAVVPHCRELVRCERRVARGARDTPPLLTVDAPEEPATEAFRSLRTSLHFGLRDPDHRVITITSPGPGAGKSTTAVNLALLLAEIGHRVVVLDGDMRGGHIDRYIQDGIVEGGLADVLAARKTWHEVVHPLGGSQHAEVITKGTTPPNPSELLLSERFGALIEELRGAYDWVLIDAPPIMAVTDAAIIAHEAAATFVVARSARDEASEVLDSIRRTDHAGAKVTGLILNDYGARQVGRTYQTYYYRYKFRSKTAATQEAQNT